MKRTLILLTAAAMVAGSAPTAPVVARDRPDRTELAPNQIAAQVDARIARIKADLRLTAEQEKNWSAFESALRDIDKKQVDRQIAQRAERSAQKGPIDVIELMRKDAEFMSARAVDQKALADAAQPLYASLDDQQKRRLADELVRRSRAEHID
jgi:hypothetical protein